MLELPNFGHMNTSTTEFESRDKILMMTSWIELRGNNLYFKIFYFKETCRADFADIIKIAIMLIKTTFKDSIKVKRLEIKSQNAIVIYLIKKSYFLVKRCWCQQNSSDVSRDLYIYWIFFR